MCQRGRDEESKILNICKKYSADLNNKDQEDNLSDNEDEEELMDP